MTSDIAGHATGDRSEGFSMQPCCQMLFQVPVSALMQLQQQLHSSQFTSIRTHNRLIAITQVSLCVGWHPQLKMGGFCWSKFLLPLMTATAHLNCRDFWH